MHDGYGFDKMPSGTVNLEYHQSEEQSSHCNTQYQCKRDSDSGELAGYFEFLRIR